jgi:predicted kinase
MVIVMAGLPATGKSEVAERLAGRLRTPLFSVDPIEAAMLRAGLVRGFETGLAAYLVVEALVDAQLRLGLDAIVDAVNAEEPAKQIWRALARKHGVTLRVIECRCSDEALHHARLAGRRRRALVGFSEPTWDEVQRRRLAYTPWREPVLALDAASPLDSNVSQAVTWLEQGAA